MSRIGNNPIKLPKETSFKIKNNLVTIKGKLGELTQQFSNELKIVEKDGEIVITRSTDQKKHRELHGLTRALISNMAVGVSEGFKKELKLSGIGYSADSKNGAFLILNLGFSHAIYLEIPEGINIETVKLTTIIISGIDKQKVGQVAAKIRSFRKPEPYKGKGIRYSDEYVRRKAGKTVGGK